MLLFYLHLLLLQVYCGLVFVSIYRSENLRQVFERYRLPGQLEMQAKRLSS